MSFVLPIIPRRPDVKRVYHLYMVFAQARDALLRYCLANGVEAKIHYPIPLYQQEGLRHLGYRAGDFPVTEYVSARTVALPFFGKMTGKQVNTVCDALEGILEKSLMSKNKRF